MANNQIPAPTTQDETWQALGGDTTPAWVPATAATAWHEMLTTRTRRSAAAARLACERAAAAMVDDDAAGPPLVGGWECAVAYWAGTAAYYASEVPYGRLATMAAGNAEGLWRAAAAK